MIFTKQNAISDFLNPAAQRAVFFLGEKKQLYDVTKIIFNWHVSSTGTMKWQQYFKLASLSHVYSY